MHPNSKQVVALIRFSLWRLDKPIIQTVLARTVVGSSPKEETFEERKRDDLEAVLTLYFQLPLVRVSGDKVDSSAKLVRVSRQTFNIVDRTHLVQERK